MKTKRLCGHDKRRRSEEPDPELVQTETEAQDWKTFQLPVNWKFNNKLRQDFLHLINLILQIS